jgi:hypothetical protein
MSRFPRDKAAALINIQLYSRSLHVLVHVPDGLEIRYCPLFTLSMAPQQFDFKWRGDSQSYLFPFAL